MEHNLEIGTILIAKTECKMRGGSEQALIVGKEYPIMNFFANMLIVETETDPEHYFSMKDENPAYYLNFFDVKK